MEEHYRQIRAAVLSDPLLIPQFHAICDCGGRCCGSTGEAKARVLLSDMLGEIADGCGGTVWSEPLPYQGWRPVGARVKAMNGNWRPVEALLWSRATPPDGLQAPVVDLGRGSEDDFKAAANRIPGAIVLVRHEYMFAPDHIHRMFKYENARKHGAAGFLIAAETLVAGSSGTGSPEDIPAGGIDEDTARQLAASGTATLEIAIEEAPAETENLFLDMPGTNDGMIVLSAHIDGHTPGESALDNASGLAASLSAARAMIDLPRRRSLRVAFFSLEEWGLDGSQRHVEGLNEAARRNISMNINLDTVAGADGLTALTSEFPQLEPFMRDVGDAAGVEIDCFAPLRANSDHYNFAVAGIPAFRLVAGFSEPSSNVRHLLTASDTRDLATEQQLQQAVIVAALAAYKALNAP